ncbi:ETX/MTX2 family pore-forming toxin [Bacillus pumilus]|uniref:ETX/MTX2 family pore-forming toxin n=1 Tax=Bacillus pumilus TaxID=1408 RepID=UPI002282034C|nr:ETX/MTX2 family pore-forming toxin [Bacillus pumilus]MCY7540848.1 ETX/MTX2 family pore-forming toxin [Bacillus pumilus]MEC3592132.1 ETX/MTX2 family pore-forming toxin [Bacillus pumilus]
MKTRKIFTCAFFSVFVLLLMFTFKPLDVYADSDAYTQLKHRWSDMSYDLRYGNNLVINYPDNQVLSKPRYFNSSEEYYKVYVQGYFSSHPIDWHVAAWMDNQFVKSIGDPIQTSTNNVIATEEVLTNNTNKPRELLTPERSFTRTYSTVLTHTNSADFGLKSTSKFMIPLVGSTKTELSAVYNYGESKSQTTTESNTIKIPSQKITVDPGQSIKVTYLITEGEAVGKLGFYGTLKGWTPNGMAYFSPNKGEVPFNFVQIGDWFLTKGKSEYNGWSYNAPDEMNYKIDNGTYKANYYSSSQLDITDIDTNQTTRINVPAIIKTN